MKRNFDIKFFCLLAFAVAFHYSAWAGPKKPKKTKQPKRVIFLIGDGMGLTQISGAMSTYTGRNAFERFEVIGLSKTSSADNYVTDSGAGATVFSIGKKAKNGAIGVDSAENAPDGLFEKLKIKGWGTGVVATSSITHATPASFYAHVKSRQSAEQIAEFLVRKNCDIAIGGGNKYFNKRKDNRNLYHELTELGFLTLHDTTWVEPNAKKLIYTMAEDGLPKMTEGRGDFLLKATKLASRNLQQHYGNYFLMVEGSQIDWGGHDNDYNYMKAELYDFNEVINAVLDAAIKDGNTLVVVTADHETGGLSLLENKDNKQTFIPHYASKGHSGVMVPVFAFGPGAELFAGIYENTEVYYKFLKLLGLDGK
jgi:alkaline phosphatase